MSLSSKLGSALAAIGLMLISFEISALAVSKLVLEEQNFVQQDLDSLRDQISLDDLQEFGKRSFDSTLGWTTTKDTIRTATSSIGTEYRSSTDKRGARLNPYQGDGGRISVYGDSFTFCAEVNDDETWPYFLSELMGTRVDNWGVNGYGTVQALLRLEGNLPENRTDVVVLTIFGENINRIVNSYRPFYFPATSNRMAFKPSVRNLGKGFEWIANPLRGTDSVEDFREAFDRAKDVDFWYEFNDRRPRVGFPYIKSLVAITWFFLFEREVSLWGNPEGAEAMVLVVGRFRDLGRAWGFRPVLLFIPSETDLKDFSRGRDYSYRTFRSEIEQDSAFSSMAIVDILEEEFDLQQFNLSPFRYHASPYGNRVIAQALERNIKEQP